MDKILFVTSNLGIGGAEQHLVLFANYLAKKGCKVLVINTNNNLDIVERFNDKIEFINIPRKYKKDLEPAKKIFEIATEHNYRTIFCDSIFAYLFVRKLAKNKHINVSIIFHLTKYFDINTYIKDFAIRVVLNSNVKLITVSQNQIQHLSKIFFIKKERFKLIYNGIDVNNFNFKLKNEFDSLKLRNELNIPEKAFVIIIVARYNIEKNHEFSIEVLNQLRNLNKINAYLVLVGKAERDRMDNVQGVVNKYGLNEYVKHIGIRVDVRPYLAISNLFILTSISETFPISALEALAMGIPAVLTNLGGTREMIVSGKNGYVASVKDISDFSEKVIRVFKGELEWNEEKISSYVRENFDVEKTNIELSEFVFSK